MAEEQLSSNEKAAPAIAIAVIALWLESAEFGELFMSQLYNTCPILIPNTFNENVDEQKLKQMVSYFKGSAPCSKKFGTINFVKK